MILAQRGLQTTPEPTLIIRVASHPVRGRHVHVVVATQIEAVVPRTAVRDPPITDGGGTVVTTGAAAPIHKYG